MKKKTEQKNVAVETKPEVVEPKAEEFHPLKWDGVELVEGKKYWAIRSRAENPDLTPLDVAENPVEVIEVTFLEGGYDEKAAEYAFDDGRLARQRVYLAVKVEERELYLYPHTPTGKKRAEERVREWRQRHAEIIAAARSKDPQACEACALNATLPELEVMMVAIGGDPSDLLKAGKKRARKVAVLMSKRLDELWKLEPTKKK